MSRYAWTLAVALVLTLPGVACRHDPTRSTEELPGSQAGAPEASTESEPPTGQPEPSTSEPENSRVTRAAGSGVHLEVEAARYPYLHVRLTNNSKQPIAYTMDGTAIAFAETEILVDGMWKPSGNWICGTEREQSTLEAGSDIQLVVPLEESTERTQRLVLTYWPSGAYREGDIGSRVISKSFIPDELPTLPKLKK